MGAVVNLVVFGGIIWTLENEVFELKETVKTADALSKTLSTEIDRLKQ